MADIPDYDLMKEPEEGPEPDLPDDDGPRRLLWLWVAFALVLAVVAYVVFVRRQAPAPETAPVAEAPAPEAPAPPPPPPLGGDAEPIDLPPIEETDPLVRDLVKGVSSHPTVAAWLTTDNLIRNLTLVVSSVAEGMTPADQLRVLRPRSGFTVVQRGGATFIDTRSYARYDRIAAAVASAEPEGIARLYATLKPRIEEAYRDLGYDQPFDRALEGAIVTLLRTPVVDGPVRLEPEGIGWAFADPSLESLTAAQKQLLRAGPENVRIIQSSLRDIALALGIPAERLPPPARSDE